jgi:hypothetical protein
LLSFIFVHFFYYSITIFRCAWRIHPRSKPPITYTNIHMVAIPVNNILSTDKSQCKISFLYIESIPCKEAQDNWIHKCLNKSTSNWSSFLFNNLDMLHLWIIFLKVLAFHHRMYSWGLVGWIAKIFTNIEWKSRKPIAYLFLDVVASPSSKKSNILQTYVPCLGVKSTLRIQHLNFFSITTFFHKVPTMQKYHINP